MVMADFAITNLVNYGKESTAKDMLSRLLFYLYINIKKYIVNDTVNAYNGYTGN